MWRKGVSLVLAVSALLCLQKKRPTPTKDISVRLSRQLRAKQELEDNEKKSMNMVGCEPFLSHGIVSHTNISYCYPPTMPQIKPHSDHSLPVVHVGVLSAAGNFEKRSVIRQTWAKSMKTAPHVRVYFLVAGPWSPAMSAEYHHHKDLLWLDKKESYRSITYKVHIFFHAIWQHASQFDYIFKTDDDSYVNLPLTIKTLKETRPPPNYWGVCAYRRPVLRDPKHPWHVTREAYKPDMYPPYALGAGYAISKSFHSCLVTKLATLPYMPNEDAGVGILASREECAVKCTPTRRFKPNNIPPVITVGVTDRKRGDEFLGNLGDMTFLHELYRMKENEKENKRLA